MLFLIGNIGAEAVNGQSRFRLILFGEIGHFEAMLSLVSFNALIADRNKLVKFKARKLRFVEFLQSVIFAHLHKLTAKILFHLEIHQVHVNLYDKFLVFNRCMG